MKKSTRRGSIGARIIHGLREFVDTLERREPITQRFNCRTIELDLQPRTYDPAMIRATRRLLGASQAVFAKFLGVSPQTVRAWEQGVNTPSVMACRFMDEIRHNPRYWLARLKEAAVMRAKAW